MSGLTTRKLLPRAAAATGAIAMGLLILGGPAAAESERVAPVSDPLVKAECAACHMAFPASFLPPSSWEAVMADLPNHFGEDASLDAETTARIRDWLVANAAREGGRGMRNTAGEGPALRITETAWWVREHDGEVSPARFADPKIGSKANCVACHRGAEKGYFEDD